MALLPLLLLLAGPPPPQGVEHCTVEVHVIPPIAGGGQRCWFTAHHNCAEQPEWSVTPGEFLQPLEDCRKPITSSKDGRGPCAYLQAGAGSYTVFARAGTGRDARSVEISMDDCATVPDKQTFEEPEATPPQPASGECRITVTANGNQVRASYSSKACGPWSPLWFSTSAQVHPNPKDRFRATVTGPDGEHLILAKLPGVATGGTFVTLGPQ